MATNPERPNLEDDVPQDRNQMTVQTIKGNEIDIKILLALIKNKEVSRFYPADEHLAHSRYAELVQVVYELIEETLAPPLPPLFVKDESDCLFPRAILCSARIIWRTQQSFESFSGKEQTVGLKVAKMLQEYLGTIGVSDEQLELFLKEWVGKLKPEVMEKIWEWMQSA